MHFFKFKSKKTLSSFPLSFSFVNEKICFSESDGVIRIADLLLDVLEYTHERNHDHFESVSCIEGHTTDQRFLSAGLDGQIKLWDLSNNLVWYVIFLRDFILLFSTINLRFPIRAMCFANSDGDLVLGLMDKLEVLSYKACMILICCFHV